MPREKVEELEALLNSDNIVQKWVINAGNQESVLKILVEPEYAKQLLEKINKKEGIRVIIHAIEGTIPKVESANQTVQEKIKIGKFITISKEELYQDLNQPVNLSFNFILMVILSAFVAGIGIMKNNIPILIGAMVIAPFLGPNMSMAFGTTLGDLQLIRKSIITGIVATLIALSISVLWGFFSGNVNHIIKDPMIEYEDIILALVCGFAGVISVVSGQGGTLVGVMVAAALLPPLMRSGLLLGNQQYQDALNSFLIFMTNIVCVNIAGILTFYFAGIKPTLWWEKEKAKKKTRQAFIVWFIVLLVIILTVVALQFIGENQL